MADKLIIVESPAKANTIKKFLGGNTKVVASMGHIRDLPAAKLSVDVKNNFTPKYFFIVLAFAGDSTITSLDICFYPFKYCIFCPLSALHHP